MHNLSSHIAEYQQKISNYCFKHKDELINALLHDKKLNSDDKYTVSKMVLISLNARQLDINSRISYDLNNDLVHIKMYMDGYMKKFILDYYDFVMEIKE